MKKIFNIAVFLGIIGFCSSAYCAANFIVQSQKNGNSTNHIPNINMCAKQGYSLTSCPSNAFPNKTCSANGKKYYDKCCDAEVYKYSGYASCVNEGLKLGDMCGGKYSCK